MTPKRTILLLAGALAVLAAAGLAVANSGILDDDGEDRIRASLSAGGAHTVTARTSDAVDTVEADYELRNTGSGPAQVTLRLTGPDGALLDSRTETVAPGDAIEIEVGHDFTGAKGAAGTYTAVLECETGQVKLTEGGVDINEREDDGPGEDD